MDAVGIVLEMLHRNHVVCYNDRYGGRGKHSKLHFRTCHNISLSHTMKTIHNVIHTHLWYRPYECIWSTLNKNKKFLRQRKKNKFQQISLFTSVWSVFMHLNTNWIGVHFNLAWEIKIEICCCCSRFEHFYRVLKTEHNCYVKIEKFPTSEQLHFCKMAAYMMSVSVAEVLLTELCYMHSVEAIQ